MADEFNLAAEIRSALTGDKTLSGKDCLVAVRKKNPRKRINENSFGNAYSTARRKLGLSKGKKVRRRKPTATASSIGATTVGVHLDALTAAKNLLRACDGDATVAATAIRQLTQLQIS